MNQAASVTAPDGEIVGRQAVRAGAGVALAVLLGVLPLAAEGPYRNRDNPSLNDSGEGTYPIPYQRPTVAEIEGVLRRVHGHLERVTATRVVDAMTRAPIVDGAKPVANAIADRGEDNAFGHLDYTMGVTHSGFLLATETTGDPRYAAFTARHLQFIADWTPYFKAQAEAFGRERNSFRSLLFADSLDASGSMCAALIKARRAGVGPDLEPAINNWMDYITHRQFRLPDGTLARQRPQRASLWVDDWYMSIPAIAQMGRLTGDRAYFDDAVKNVLQSSQRLFDQQRGLLAHGLNLDQPEGPRFFWARGNGWAMVALVELLEVLPEDHPGRSAVLDLLRAQIRGVSERQSGSGLWHQLLDRTDSYLETSATGMFVFSIARAINRGWISPIGYGSVAQAGWAGLSTRVDSDGVVDGTCVGTTFASDAVYYYHRPTTRTGTMGYGPVVLAAAEMVRLMQNESFEIQLRNRTYHYVPKQ